jgi:hypothetical protein
MSEQLRKLTESAKYDKELRKKIFDCSPYWPQHISIVDHGPEGDRPNIYFSTLLRKQYSDKWYVIHHMESAIRGYGFVTVPNSILVQRLTHSVYLSMLFYDLTGNNNPLDKLQISEEERLQIYK